MSMNAPKERFTMDVAITAKILKALIDAYAHTEWSLILHTRNALEVS